jgi:4'-phosphopantetheinyl transferase
MHASLSISHSGGRGFCAVSLEGRALGCDVERIEVRSAAFIRDYFLPEEQDRVYQGCETVQPMLANLIWSAKESAMKVLREGLRVDTRRLEVQLGESASGWNALQVYDRETDVTWPGHWRRSRDFVMTLVGVHTLVALAPANSS